MLVINHKLKKTPIIGQDWASVFVGFVIVSLALITIELYGSDNIDRLLFTNKFDWGNLFELKSNLFSRELVVSVLSLLIISLITSVLGMLLSGASLKLFLPGFISVFFIGIIAEIISSFTFLKNYGVETVIISLLFGLFISNITILPAWLNSGIQTELYVKIGLVLLGSRILFQDVLQAGFLGIIQAVVVVVSVWYFAFWISKKLKICDEYATLLASAVSICGVSAAIATAGAINGDKKKLSFIISIVLIVSIPMMIFMPIVAGCIGLSEKVTGAWLGATIDTTGAVVGAGSFAGEIVLKYATIVKFSQNVLLGIAAFAISIFWANRNSIRDNNECVSMVVIWNRFPKFVLGFIALSIIFSFLLDSVTTKEATKVIRPFGSLYFNLAFVSIGLETKLRDLKSTGRIECKRVVYSFAVAQGFNIVFALGVAWVLFGFFAG